jgi:hypothetical protein
MDPLLGKGNIVTSDGQRWKVSLLVMYNPVFR